MADRSSGHRPNEVLDTMVQSSSCKRLDRRKELYAHWFVSSLIHDIRGVVNRSCIFLERNIILTPQMTCY
jgi:hypothetical protein